MERCSKKLSSLKKKWEVCKIHKYIWEEEKTLKNFTLDLSCCFRHKTCGAIINTSLKSLIDREEKVCELNSVIKTPFYCSFNLDFYEDQITGKINITKLLEFLDFNCDKNYKFKGWILMNLNLKIQYRFQVIIVALLRKQSCKFFSGKCPICDSSFYIGEKIIAGLLTGNGIDYFTEFKVKPYKYRYDFFIPSKNLIIEYDGKQHFKDVKYFKSTKEKNQKIDKEKDKIAIENGYKIFRINLTIIKNKSY